MPMMSAVNNTDVIEAIAIPPHLLGMWGHWEVKNEIETDLSPDSPDLDQAVGLFLGFGSGDRAVWAKRLPELQKLKYLVSWTGNNPQSLFDSITKMKWLKRLCFGRLSAKDISTLADLHGLEFLCIHRMSGPTALQPIVALENLRVLELGLNSKIADLDCFANNNLHSLQSIQLYANKPRIDFPSIKPLSAVKTLEYLSIPTVRADDADLRPLLELPKLKYLHLAKKSWPKSELEVIEKANISFKLGF